MSDAASDRSFLRLRSLQDLGSVDTATTSQSRPAERRALHSSKPVQPDS